MMPGYDDRLQQDAASFFPSGNIPPPANKIARRFVHPHSANNAAILDSLPPTQVLHAPFLLTTALKVAVFNCNGLLTKSQSQTDTEVRVQ